MMSKPISKTKSKSSSHNRVFARRRKADQKKQLQHEKEVGAALGVTSVAACRGVSCLHEILDITNVLRAAMSQIEDDEEANIVWNGFRGVAGELNSFIAKVHAADDAAEKKEAGGGGEEVHEESEVVAPIPTVQAAGVEVEMLPTDFENKGKDRDEVSSGGEIETEEEYLERLRQWEKTGEEFVATVCGDLQVTPENEGDDQVVDSPHKSSYFGQVV